MGSHGEITDLDWAGLNESGKRVKQLIVGPVTDAVRELPPPYDSSLSPGGRFTFLHRPLRHQRNYGEVLFRVPPMVSELLKEE